MLKFDNNVSNRLKRMSVALTQLGDELHKLAVEVEVIEDNLTRADDNNNNLCDQIAELQETISRIEGAA